MTEEQATKSGEEVIAQLRSRRNSFYNRNKFYFRTDDTQATLIRKYCAKNKTSWGRKIWLQLFTTRTNVVFSYACFT